MKLWRKPFDAEEKAPPGGELRIIEDRCKGCGFCVEFCPLSGLVMSDEFNAKGYHFPVLKETHTCLMCGLCQALCPEFAIYCIPEKETDKK